MQPAEVSDVHNRVLLAQKFPCFQALVENFVEALAFGAIAFNRIGNLLSGVVVEPCLLSEHRAQ